MVSPVAEPPPRSQEPSWRRRMLGEEPPPSLAWSGPCDVIVRRHPKGGYLFDFTGSGAPATRAQWLHHLAEFSARKAIAPDQPSSLPDLPLNREHACRVVEVMRGINVLVDDKALKIDARMSQWGKALPIAILFGFLAAAVLREGREGWWSIASTALIFLIGVLVGGLLRHLYEQDGALIPAPWGLAVRVAMTVAVFVGFGVYVIGVMWAVETLGGWGIVAGAVILLIIMYLVVKFFSSRKAG